MKKIFFILITLMIVSSCDLTEKPYSIGESTLKESADGAKLISNSAYGAFWQTGFANYYAGYANFDCDYENALSWLLGSYGSGVLDDYMAGGIYQIYYQIIARANYAIETIPTFMNTPEKERNQLLGEMLFIRGFMYYEIVRCWGKVPLRTSFYGSKDMARSSIDGVYNQIISDLSKADELMTNWGMSEWGRASKTSAKLLLARVYSTLGAAAVAKTGATVKVNVKGLEQSFMTKPVAGYDSYDATECYTQVEALCSQVIARRGMEFDLQPNYQSIWGNKNRKNKEFVWGIAGNGNYKNSQLSIYYTAIYFGGYGWAGMSKYLYDLYESTDNRAKYGVFHHSKQAISDDAAWFYFPNNPAFSVAPDGKPATYAPQSEMPFVTKWYVGDVTNPTIDGGSVVAQDQDMPLIRFCDAYLLRAEALNELNKPSLALADLKVIRDRAEASDKSGLSDKVDVRSAILEERALEYTAEFNRRYDLLRWGLYLDVMNATQSIPTTNGVAINKTRDQRGLLWAIPAIEFNSNKLCGTENNPGY